jgi:peroxiredoxin
MAIDMDAADFRTAVAKLAETDAARAKADFTLTDMKGKPWTLSSLKGKVVLVNFWATWCPPCRKEMPDLNTLYSRFKDQGFVILAMSDEDRPTVEKYIGEHPVDYPILLDPDRKVNSVYQIEGIPKSFIYDRTGKMVAQSIDMRTMGQFLQLLEKAGLK